jgi:hypothetical protein
VSTAADRGMGMDVLDRRLNRHHQSDDGSSIRAVGCHRGGFLNGIVQCCWGAAETGQP